MFGQSGQHKSTVSVASGATVTSYLTVPGGYNRMALEVGTFAAGVSTTTANIYVQVCDTATGTYRRLAISGVYSGSSGIADWEVPSSTGARYWQLPDEVAGYNYMKVEFSNTCTAGISVNVHSMM